MKIRLNIGEESYDEVKSRLTAAGFEIGDDGEFILSEPDARSHLVAVRDKEGQKLRIAADRVIYIESYGHDVEVHTTEGLYYSPDRLYRLTELLDSREFMRVSNSVIISRHHVVKISPSLSMKFVLTMSDGTRVDVTRSYYYSFKEFFGI